MSLPEKKVQIIRKSNELIEARYKLSIAEQRLVLLLASEIAPDDEDFKDYEIRVVEFAKMFGLESDKSLYEKIEESAKELVGKKICLSRNGEAIYTTWLSYIRYTKGSGTIKLRFDKSLKPYFLQLKSHFTQYRLDHVMSFKNQYSIRLYELLKMGAYKAKNKQFEKTFELQEYRLLLGVDKKAYLVFADFRKCVIEPLVNEISEKTDLIINHVKYGKTGRKITNVTFFVQIRSKEETNLRQANSMDEETKPGQGNENHPIIDSLVNLGFSLEIAKAYKTKHGVKKIERNIAYTLAKKQEGKVKDIPAYLNMAIESDYGGAWDIGLKTEGEKRKQALADQKTKELQESENKKMLSERYRSTLQAFHQLPEDVQAVTKQNFLATYEKGNFVYNEWVKAEKANKNPIDKAIIKGAFIKFLMDQ